MNTAFKKELLFGLVVLALLAALPLLSPGRVTLDFVIRLAALGVFATSLNILVGYGGMVSFGHAMFFGGGAYTFGLLMQRTEVSIPVKLKEIYFSFLTLAFQMLIHSVIITWTSLTGGDQGLMGGIPRRPFWGGINVADPNTLYWFCVVIGVVSLLIMRYVLQSPFGYTLRMVRDNADRARFLGIDVWRIRLYAFILAGAFAGIGGSLMALFVSGAYPEFSYWTMSGEAVFMIMMGGINVFLGPIIGAGLLNIFNDVITRTTEYHGLALGVIVLIFALGFKRGITDFVGELYNALTKKRVQS
jgi:branched-chain amino acid transport system permease protein